MKLWLSRKRDLEPENLLEQLGSDNFLRLAFPVSLTEDVDSVLKIMPVAIHLPTLYDKVIFYLNNQEVHLPSRVYNAETRNGLLDTLSEKQKTIYACIHSRNHDGYVRENSLKYLIENQTDWSVPYILQLLGEYVVEITQIIENDVKKIDKDRVSHFALINPKFICLIRHRVISYWDCYYRGEYPVFSEYPAYKVMDSLGLWDDRDGKKLLRVRT
ncbi:MAG: hypothetical protein PHE50_01230 [Dehalococcoidales bacterium]|nr:hypothetical protein [Dehalococcoidales bacterium]